jgi:interleukin-1 receptor-associated kinase 1
METTIGVNYIISVDYIPLQNQLSIEVSVDAQGQPNPESLKASMSLNAVDYSSIWPYGLFTFSSSVGQLEKLKDWNLTVERFHENRGRKGSTAIIVSAVLGSAAATAVAAAVLYWYFNSRYRRYQKDLDQLAKSMQLLPGMPTKFNFSDIQKATCNFNEKMKLGQGGFGAVYRCRLLLKRGEVLEVAVKKFSRNKNRGYQDFLAEVSVINRLRHKNIVPLIGKDNKHLI